MVYSFMLKNIVQGQHRAQTLVSQNIHINEARPANEPRLIVVVGQVPRIESLPTAEIIQTDLSSTKQSNSYFLHLIRKLYFISHYCIDPTTTTTLLTQHTHVIPFFHVTLQPSYNYKHFRLLKYYRSSLLVYFITKKFMYYQHNIL